MKKNLMMRLASFLLVAVLISTSAISGTYAKYVTADGGSDTARVAAFGVTVVENFNDLFKPSYTTDKPWTPVGDELADDGFTVWSVYGGDLVAPGTMGSLVDFTVTGKPEVDVYVTYTPVFELENWTLEGGAEYCPIIITVNGETYGTNDTNATHKSSTVADLMAVVNEKIVGSAAYYNAGTDLSTVVYNDLAVSWEWPFETGADPAAIAVNDKKDTYLGDWILRGDDAATISLEITCTVTQVD